LDVNLQSAHDNAHQPRVHYLKSPHYSTQAMLATSMSVIDQLSRMAPYGDIDANGVSLNRLEAGIFAWADGMAKRVGDEALAAVLLGAFRRAVVTLERRLGGKVIHAADGA
jgi:hypothetical protein